MKKKTSNPIEKWAKYKHFTEKKKVGDQHMTK